MQQCAKLDITYLKCDLEKRRAYAMHNSAYNLTHQFPFFTVSFRPFRAEMTFSSSIPKASLRRTNIVSVFGPWRKRGMTC